MYKDIREDISIDEKKDFLSSITLISNKINVIIIGGGNAAYIKAKSLVNRGFKVVVLSKEFTSEFYELEGNLKLIKASYNKSYILNNHLIVIAVDDEIVRSAIINDCEEIFKIYINCSDFKEGIALNPLQIESENLICAINSKRGNPKALRILEKEIKPILENLDGFVKFTTDIREKIKGKEYYRIILDFMFSNDFIFFYKKGYGENILNLFFKDMI